MNKLIIFLGRYKFVIIIGLANIAIFGSYLSFDINTPLLLDLGANFAPFTLDKESYRLISSMFLHGYPLHLIVNMYSLFYLGSQMESTFGGQTFIRVYFFTGIIASISSIYFNLFAVSVGASGAIFGLYGYLIVYNLESKSQKKSFILINFFVYMGLMLILGKRFQFDNAAHFGGAIAGILIRLIDRFLLSNNVLNWAFMLLIIPIFLVIPKYQVEYYKAYQYMVQKDLRISQVFGKGLSDFELLRELKEIKPLPDSICKKFENIDYIPFELQRDTAVIGSFFKMKNSLIDYYIKGVSNETFIYLDSIEYIRFKIKQLPRPQYILNFDLSYKVEDTLKSIREKFFFTKQYYDEDWFEVDEFSASYYRLGKKDSLGDWHGIIQDYYIDGAIQMKGKFQRGLKNGIFIYYNADSTYSSAGRYVDDDKVGKWEIYYHNGSLSKEIRHHNGKSYIENVWDSLGYQMVSNGNGVEEYKYKNGIIKFRRPVNDGLNHGYVLSYDKNGSQQTKEYHQEGKLIRGVSYDKEGNSHIYDMGSTFNPYPDGGYEKFYKHIKEHNLLLSDTVEGVVHLRFDVHFSGRLNNIRFLKRMGQPYDEYAKNLLLDYPEWNPALFRGFLPRNSSAEVYIRF